MRILHLNLNNFFSFKEAEFDFRPQSGLIFVAGRNLDDSSADSNGAGKSALFVEAIPWALYGSTIREKIYGSTSREFSKDDVVNIDAGKDCSVILRFSVGDETYEVWRYRNHTHFGNSLEFWKLLAPDKPDGLIQTLSGESVAETNQKIIDVIGINYSAYCNAVVYGQGTVKRFTQCTDAERRKILEDFLQLEIYSQAQKLANEDLKSLLLRIAEWQGAWDNAEARLSETCSYLDRARQRRDSAINDVRRHTSTTAHITQAKQSELVEKQTAWTDCIADLEKSVNALAELELERDTLQPPAPVEDSGTSPLLEHSVQKAEIESKIKQTRLSIAKWKASILAPGSVANMKLGEPCPMCFRKFTQSAFTRYKKTLRENIADAEDQLQALFVALQNVEKILEDWRRYADEEAEIDRRLSELSRKHRNEELQRNSLEADMRVLKAEIAQAEGRREELERMVEDAEREVLRLTRREAFLRKAQTVYKKLMADLQREADAARFWVQGFSSKGVKDLIFRQSLDFLNAKLAEYASVVSAGEMRVEIRKDLSVKVDIDRGAQTYQTASGGQGKRIDLMIGLAMQSLVEAGWQDCNLKVIDEFDASLDKAGVDGFLSLLREEAKRKGAIYVISHNDYLAEQFDQVIYVEKHNGASAIASG